MGAAAGPLRQNTGEGPIGAIPGMAGAGFDLVRLDQMKVKNDVDMRELVEAGGSLGANGGFIELDQGNDAAPHVVNGGFDGRADHADGNKCHSIHDTAILDP